MLLEQLYSKVKPVNLYKEEYKDKTEDTRFIMEIKNVNVYNVEKDSYSLTTDPNSISLIYDVEFDFRNWGIKEFNVIPRKLSAFSIQIEDDYSQEDFSESQTILEFPQGLDASGFKIGDIEWKPAYTLAPTMIDLWIKQVDGKWQIVPEMCEISFS